jgi:hypothetical protein
MARRVPIAAFVLGHLYEVGVSGLHAVAQDKFQPDLAKAWTWYKQGADAGEPNALAETDIEKRAGLLLQAFSNYAAAAERARDGDWPDEAWRQWRYRRATLARLLAREGMMQQVADAYQTVRDRWSAQSLTVWQIIKTRLHFAGG